MKKINYTKDESRMYRELKLKIKYGEPLTKEEFYEYTKNNYGKHLTMVAVHGFKYLLL